MRADLVWEADGKGEGWIEYEGFSRNIGYSHHVGRLKGGKKALNR
jgi:hypothetical protein